MQQAQRQRPRGGAKQRASHSDSVVDSLKTQLMTATKDFQDVLHTRSNNIKALQDRLDRIKESVDLSVLPVVNGNGRERIAVPPALGRRIFGVP